MVWRVGPDSRDRTRARSRPPRRGLRLLGLALCLLAFSAARAEDQLALVGGTAITATGAPPLEDAVILIEDGRIQGIGARSKVAIPEGYDHIDLAGKWITPGLIDTNVHLILLTVPEFFVKYEERFTDIAIQSAQIALKYGMTTVVDTWGPLQPLLEARDRINRGEVPGSRVLVAGNIVGTGGPFTAYFMGGWDLRDLSLRYGGWVHPAIQQRINRLWEDDVGPAMLAMTADEAAATMRAYIAKGVDFVKVGVSGHGLGAVEPLMFSPTVLKAICDEVHRAGLPLVTHTFTVESLRLAIEMKPDLLLHPNVMSVPFQHASNPQKAAVLSLAQEAGRRGMLAGLMAVPEKLQLAAYQNWDASQHPDQPWLNQIMADRGRMMAGRDYETMVSGLRVWLDAGVPFTLATDQGPDSTDLGPVVWGRMGRMHFDRMIGLQDAGVPPMEIIQAATRNGARAYRLDDELGTLEAGKVADILILDRDPLADIANMRNIGMVIMGGRVVDRDRLPTIEVLDYDPELPWPE